MFMQSRGVNQHRMRVWAALGPMLFGASLTALALPAAQDASLPEAAKTAVLKGDWAGVLATLEKSDIKEPDAVCRMVVGHACLATNRNNQALILFLATEKGDADIWKRWTEALAKENPESAVAQYLRGDALARTGDVESAVACLTEALKHDPGLGLAWGARGSLKAVAGRMDEAYLDFLQAVKVQPTLSDAHASLGCYEVMEQNAEGALEAFNAALRLDPGFALAYNGRGCARYGLGKPDEAHLDFEMAITLCPALVVTEANQSFVLAMVARKVDENIQSSEKPGTTLEMRSQSISAASQLFDDKALRAAYEKDGFAAVNQTLSQQRQTLLTTVWDNNRWMQSQYQPGIAALNGSMMAIESTKSAMRVGNALGALAKGGLPAFFAQGAFYLAKDGIGWTADVGQSQPLRGMTKTVLAGITRDGRFDPFSAGLHAAREGVDLSTATLHSLADRKLRETTAAGLMIGEVDNARRTIMAWELAKNPQTFAPATNPADMGSRLTGLTLSSSQQWSQMPKLLDDLTRGRRVAGPVALVAQDPVKSFAFERMLNNRGIPTVVTPPVDASQLSRLGSAFKPSSLVGFSRDLIDPNSYRKALIPWWPDDHGGGGAAVATPRITSPITIQGNTFSFPDSKGGTVTLPLPRSFSAPAGTWNSFKPWTPKGDAGGVDTNLEWVFVDKGNWPVMTFFTLAYESSRAGQATAPKGQ